MAAAPDVAGAAASLHPGEEVEEGAEEVPAMLREPPGQFVRTLMGTIKATVQAAQLLPGEAEFEYQSSLVASKELLDSSSSRVAALIQRSAGAWGMGLQLRPSSDPDDAFETLVDVTDSIFESVDDCASPHRPPCSCLEPCARGADWCRCLQALTRSKA
jgi:hypothetical protein